MHTFSNLLLQHMQKYLYIATFFVVLHSVWTQQSYTRSSYSQEDVSDEKTILQTHQEEPVGLDSDINIKYHQQSTIMFLFRASKGNRCRGQNQFKLSHLAAM